MAMKEDGSRSKSKAKDDNWDHETKKPKKAEEISIEDLGLSVRVVDVLKKAGLETVEEVVAKMAEGEAEFRTIPGIGPKAYKEVQKQLQIKGYSKDENNIPNLESKKYKSKGKETKGADRGEGKKEEIVKNISKMSETKSESVYSTSSITGEDISSISNLAEMSSVAKGAEKPISFVVRVTADDQGQVRRTEIQDARSGKKSIFPKLDGQRLIDFIMKSIKRAMASSPELKPVSPRDPKPSIKPKASLSIADAEIKSMGSTTKPGVFDSKDAMRIENRFRIEGGEAASLTQQGGVFDIKIYANSMRSGKASLLTSKRGKLVKDVLEYREEMEVSDLSPGHYRLDTLVILQEPARVAEYHEGPRFHIIEG